MRVVADSGPLIAFAKTDGLDTLFGVYPEILTPRAVFEEAVNEGEHLQAPDAFCLLVAAGLAAIADGSATPAPNEGRFSDVPEFEGTAPWPWVRGPFTVEP